MNFYYWDWNVAKFIEKCVKSDDSIAAHKPEEFRVYEPILDKHV